MFATTSYASHSWGGYHWARTKNPFTLKLGDNMTSAWDPYLATTSADWSVSTVLDTTIVPGRTKPKACKPSSGRVEVCNATYGNNGWLGLAQIWISGSHIMQGVVKNNDTYFKTSTYNTSAWKNLVTCQEVGHTFGLDHQDENFNNANLGTCMDYTSSPGTNQHPNQHDYDQLASIYAHTDSFNSYDTSSASSSASPGKSAGADDRSDWGREVSRGDHHSVYERDLGGGRKLVTHVIWA